MLNKQRHSILIFFLISCIGFSQTETDSTKTEISTNLVVIDSVVKKPIDALSPSKAAFYSAVLPGLGQAYNKKYWKIPIVYAAIGTGVYFYIQNDKDYDRYRDAYKRRLAGFTDDEFYGPTPGSPRVTSDGLIRAQQTLKRNKELSLLVTIGFYALNIIDANVDAHLLQYNVDENLAVRPHFQYNEWENSSDLGLTLNFKF
ncbi:hypothetical protein GCM10011531_19070 [Aquaticitalea lipolytica]|uniref:DUF5683 domain-containing protein n=1 Tax=Aquaticitalea lipolytica TaxID=1247562 RepID=A0A8J2TQT2_9FLAO|nr:DUF5683 domain-containing protein [Aquaticitalea lipolytica]GFZ87728.1 hypothetical protein GCM10011531_19070 [Aquaticitalea lipolytica]